MAEAYDQKIESFNKRQITTESIQFAKTDDLIHSLTEGIRTIRADDQYDNPNGFHVFINDDKKLFLCFYSTIPEVTEDSVA